MKSIQDIQADLHQHPHYEALKKVLPRLLSAINEPSEGSKPFFEVLDNLNAKYGNGDPGLREEILTFFSNYKDRYYLGGTRSEEAAVIIAEAMIDESPEKIAWATGAAEPKIWKKVGFLEAAQKILSPEKLDVLMSTCITKITSCCDRDRVFSPQKMRGGKIAKGSFRERSEIHLYWDLAYRHPHLIHHEIYSSIGNMIELLADMWKGSPDKLIAGWDHPAIQARFGTEYGQAARKRNLSDSLSWITAGASKMTIAVGIVETLQTVMRLDIEAHELSHSGDVKFKATSLDTKTADISGEKENLLRTLADKISRLPPPENFWWIGALLSEAEYILPRTQSEEIGKNQIFLEEALEKVAAEALILGKTNTKENIMHLMESLRLPPRQTTSSHLYDIGHLLREHDFSINTALLLTFIEDYREQLKNGTSFHVNFDIHGKVWTERLALAAAQLHQNGDIEFKDWFTDQLKPLPLSLWDFEEDSSRFIPEQSRTRHLLLTASLVVRNLARTQDVEPLADIVLDKIFSYWKTVLEVPLLRHGDDLDVLLVSAASLILETRIARQQEYIRLLKADFRTARSGGLQFMTDSADPKVRLQVENIMIEAFNNDLESSAIDLHWWIECWRRVGNFALGVRALGAVDLVKDPFNSHRETYSSYLDWLAKKNVASGLSDDERKVAGRLHGALWGHVRIPSEDSTRKRLEGMLPGITSNRSTTV